MQFDFNDKTIVVTGGSTGIGLSIAELFGKLGGKVSICGRSEEKLEAAVDYLKSKKIDVFAKSVDVSNKKSIFEYADEVEEKLGTINVWISNASIYPQYKIIDTPEDVWERTIDINLKSVYYGALIARDKMKEGGALINAASFAAIMPSVGSGLYAATKAAVVSMTKTLAAELAPLNIRVNGYIPGVIRSNMTNPLIKVNGEKMKQAIALNEFGNGEDVANAVAYLASDYASYITGAFIEISGGKFCVQNPTASWQE